MSERPLQCQCCGGLVCLFRELRAALLTRVEERRYNRKSREQSERIIAMTKESVIKNLQGAECFYVPFSISTKMPYVICDEEDFDDQILAFEEEEDLKAYVKARAEEKILLQVTRVEKSMYTRFYGNLYGIGVNAIVYKKGQEERKVELKFSNCQPSDVTISVSGGKGAYVDDIQVYTFVTRGELYNMDGSEGKCIEALRLMNQKL